MSRANFTVPGVTEIIQDSTALHSWGQPEDVASAVVFLCSGSSDYITGAEILVDGGWCAGKGF
jgi:NAD(P)-dependent dehydrogenase (short-subunit alcohol dehydrogenase family)